MSSLPHWADVLTLREEVTESGGQLADLQMSLYSAVWTDRAVPYRDPGYYSDITEPTPGLIQFMATIAHRLGGGVSGGKALYHLDQGMGGGKSHALVGLYHLVTDPDAFLRTTLGTQIAAEVEHRGGALALSGSRVIVLSADNMTPKATSPDFGPATNLYQRFLWALFEGDQPLYDQHVADGPNKAALSRALRAADAPVLILLDELMDYAMLLSDEQHIASMPAEKAFLNALMDAVDDVPRVVCVVVMIRSDLDERGYTVEADALRSYVAARIERNGTTLAVTEAQDFSAIIRRRLFHQSDPPIKKLATAWRRGADDAWETQVFERLGAGRALPGFSDRLETTYPFSPDLITLVRDDWSRHAGFQRVRSTVEIFATTVHYWVKEHQAGRWAPPLIGPGDIPLTVAVEPVLSSGLLHGNERMVQGYRQVAATDVISKDGTKGRARELDKALSETGLDLLQPQPAVRMATALFCYSLVPRAQARRGATKAELLAAIYGPEGVPFQGADEVFNTLTGDDEGLGALEITEGRGGSTPTRYQLAVTQTLRMFFRQARATVQPGDRDTYIWERAKALAAEWPGNFDRVVAVSAEGSDDARLAELFSDVDQNNTTRLVVLDPRRWTLLNGRDAPTRDDITTLLGVGETPLPVDNAASCVVAAVNTQRRETVRNRATEAMAWQAMADMLEPDDEKRDEARRHARDSAVRVDADLQRAFQHYAFVTRTDRVEVDWRTFDDDLHSSLRGPHVWDALVAHGRAARPGSLSGDYIRTLLEDVPRALTLKELTQQFYKNPAFPMVSSVADVRQAIFRTLGPPPDGYEIVDGTGQPLAIQSADDLALGSMDQTLQRSTAFTESETEHDGEPDQPEQPTPRDPAAYKRYALELPNRSLADIETRRKVANLLQAVLDSVDPDIGGDVQLLDLRLALTASEDSITAIPDRAADVDALWRIEELDF